MSKKTDAWMPLYVGDYLADTMHLTTRQHGAYILLLLHAWVSGGLLPFQDDKLRAICRMQPKEWKEDRDDIRAFFVETGTGLRHKRVDIELGRADAIVQQRSVAGKASAEQRKRQRELNGRSTGEATGEATNAQQTAIQSQSHITSKSKEDAALPRPDDCWSVGIRVLSPVLEAAKARAFIGKLLRDYPEDTVKDALSEAEGSAEPRSYVNGILAKKPRKKGSSAEVEARYLEGLRGAI